MIDRLDDLLSPDPHLDGDEFTNRLMARLPPRRESLRPLVLGVATAAAGLLAVAFLPGLVATALPLLAGGPAALGPLAALTAGSSALAAGVAALAAALSR